ncbi:MAG: PilZ domain-containing protein [Rhodocyclales bacterium]|nr:PilZ domain-containing protein [Rhodocyclales bacterium]
MNQRLYPRRLVALHLRVYDQQSGALLGRIGDISEGGLLLYGSRTLETGVLYTLRIDFPSDEGASQELTIKAKAMWSGPDLNPAFIATGLRFFDLENPEHLGALQLLLSHLTIGRDDLEEG